MQLDQNKSKEELELELKELRQAYIQLLTEKGKEEAKPQSPVTSPVHGTIPTFQELFDLEEIQAIQDSFALATGVASIITEIDGSPITRPSNFCRLCSQIIRKTEKGCKNCYKSDAIIGRYHKGEPIIQPCLSGGLWDGGASISVGGKHIANWLIGQVRNDMQEKDKMLKYCREIGADEEEFSKALDEVTVMPLEQFKQIGRTLYLIANQMSEVAYQKLMFKRLELYLSNVINSMPSLLAGVDMENCITQWNLKAEEYTGCKSDDVIGKPLEDILPDLKDELKHIPEAIASNEAYTALKEKTDSDQQTRYEQLTIYPLTSNNAMGAVIRIDDITDQIRMQTLLNQSEKMLSVSGLAAGMAHEINNPLAAITQGIQNILRRIDPDNPKNVEIANEYGFDIGKVHQFMNDRRILTFLKLGRDACDRAATIVRNMLTFSRKSDSLHVPVDMVKLIEHTIELGSVDYDMKKRYDFKFANIIREYDDDVPEINCCPDEIEQVLLNLFKNAVQAMEDIDEKGYKPTFNIRLFKETDFIRIEIQDNGPGIPKEIQPRLFEPFFTTKPVGKGTGLGLSVSYSIITHNHAGTFEVSSVEGRGTTFKIRLPL